VEAYKEGERVELSVLRCNVAEHNVAGNSDILNISRSAVGDGLTIGRLERAIVLKTISDDESIRTMIRAYREGLGTLNAGKAWSRWRA
jgi:hypothetical protein